ncbi:MAG: riboflavin synthase [Xanthomonadales bacterium]|nr:riboflavin synthase [Gammaproteobacteria bacterium]NNK03493.1 riboflavin synthase [Xanthomonadales bacterium]NNK97892.1 riboflavin synthase [Xanthomonadales bacterium]
MFTGIVAATGKLQSRESFNGDLRIRFEVPKELMEGCHVGDSISISGVCLTMLDPDATGFSADLSVETLDKTSLGDRRPGDSVNLELAMRASDRLGGHLVSGHVDGLATLISREGDARSERFVFETERSLAKYIAPKGSACLDGVSLTVNEVDDNRFSICIIPHTLEVTTLGNLGVGENVNLEVDLIARYLDRLNQYGNVGGESA